MVEREHARDLPGLLAQVRSGDVEQRRWAVRDLVPYGEAAPALGEQLLREREPSVREALFTALAAMASESAAAALLPLLRSEDAQMRNGAIEVLVNEVHGDTGERGTVIEHRLVNAHAVHTGAAERRQKGGVHVQDAPTEGAHDGIGRAHV